MINFVELGGMPQAVATAFAAWIALRISRKWRQEAIGKRRHEVAEEALVAVYNFRRALIDLRRPELTKFERTDVTPSIRANSFEIFKCRLEQRENIFSKLEGFVLLVNIYFDERTADALLSLVNLAHRARSAAKNLEKLGTDFRPEYDNAEQYEHWRNDMHDLRVGAGDLDHISSEMQKLVHMIEIELKPHLKLPTEPDAPPHWRDTGRDLSPVWLLGRNGVPRQLFRIAQTTFSNTVTIARVVSLSVRDEVAARRRGRKTWRG